MDPAKREIAIQVQGHAHIFSKLIHNNLCTRDRDAAFDEIQRNILSDERFEHYRAVWGDGEVKRIWTTMRQDYCRKQLSLGRGDIEEEDLPLADRDFLSALSFLEPYVQHRDGSTNTHVRAPVRVFQQQVEDFYGENPELIQALVDEYRRALRRMQVQMPGQIPARRGGRRGRQAGRRRLV